MKTLKIPNMDLTSRRRIWKAEGEADGEVGAEAEVEVEAEVEADAARPNGCFGHRRRRLDRPPPKRSNRLEAATALAPSSVDLEGAT